MQNGQPLIRTAINSANNIVPNLEECATSCEMSVVVPVARSTGQKRSAKGSSNTTKAPRKKLQLEQEFAGSLESTSPMLPLSTNVMFETNEVDEHDVLEFFPSSDIPAQILDDFDFEEDLVVTLVHWTEEDWKLLS